jgi:predicted RND superfamily exporter protein
LPAPAVFETPAPCPIGSAGILRGRRAPPGEWEGLRSQIVKQFGIGRLGAAIVNHARLSAALAVALTVGALAAISGGLVFNGDITDLLRVDTPGYRDLQRMEKDFHPFSTDEVIVVESAGFGDPAAFDALAELVAELQLTTGVEAVVSIFSLPAHGSTEPYLASVEAGALSPGERLEVLLEGQFLAADLLSKDLTTTLVVLAVAQDGGALPTNLGTAGRREIEDAAARHAPALTVSLAGMNEIHRTIEEGLKRDQRLLAVTSTLLCVALSLLIFRSWRGALICAVPPVTGAIWFFGFAAITGIAIDPVTAIIPTLIIVVGFADSVHLCFTYLRIRPESRGVADAARRTMMETGPACMLTSLTTAVSCLGVGFAGSAGLNAFAIGGFFGLVLQFCAALLCFPLLLMALERNGRLARSPNGGAFSVISRGATSLLGFGRPILLLSIAAFAGLVYAQARLPIGFQLSEHLRSDGDLAKLQQRIGAKGLGSAYVYLIVPDTDGVKGLSPADIAVFERIGSALFADRLGTSGAPFLNAQQLDRLAAEDPALLKRFVAADGLRYLVPIPLDPTLSAEDIERACARIVEQVEAAEVPGPVEIIGIPLLSAREVPAMIRDLQLGFLVALLLVVLIIVYATGSARLGLLSLIPNLMPILGVEAVLYVASVPLTMTASVALTIAFGIAVDNSIHLLSRYQQPSDADPASRLLLAVGEVATPITATTLLLVVGLSVTQVSTMPAVAVFGQLASLALVLAMASSLFLLPAFIAPRRRGNSEK